MTSISYHDLHITTPQIRRTPLTELPFRVRVDCCRAAGWQVWALEEAPYPAELLGGEYDFDHETQEGRWLVLDVAGHIICDSRSVYL